MEVFTQFYPIQFRPKNSSFNELQLHNFQKLLYFPYPEFHTLSYIVFITSNNRIGVNGASKLAPGLAVHPSLETFKVFFIALV